MDAATPPWSELLPELVGSIVTRLPTAADCARLRAVCRSWRSAMRHHGSPVRHPPPWVFLPDGRFLGSFHGRSAQWRRLASYPQNATCFGATGSWLALYHVDAKNRHRCLLYNPFTGTTVPRPELDDIIDNICLVRKVLMPRGPHDDLALATTDYRNDPFMLARFGKGAGVPKAQITTSKGIIDDIAFLGGKLYGITITNDLYCLDIGFGDDGAPIVTSTQIVIEHLVREAGDEDDEEENNNEVGIYDVPIVITYLDESRGMLFMVKQQRIDSFTRKVEVSEADIKAGVWKPLVAGLGGQALFLGNSLINFVPACGEIEEDAVYFMDTGDIFCMRSQTNRVAHAQWNSDFEKLMRGVLYLDRPNCIFPLIYWFNNFSERK